MKYMLLIHHVEAIDENDRADLLQESIQLANQLHEKRQYLDAAPLQSVSSTAAPRSTYP